MAICRKNAERMEFWMIVKIIRPVTFWDAQGFGIISERLYLQKFKILAERRPVRILGRTDFGESEVNVIRFLRLNLQSLDVQSLDVQSFNCQSQK